MRDSVHISQRVVEGLGCMSYLIGDEGSGEAIVIDPQMMVADDIAEAEGAGFVITHVVDTHLHADHVSGNRALAARTGATIHIPGAARVNFPHESMYEGDEVRVGDVVLRVRETPGHTPEHVTLELIDRARASDRPFALFTGDTLFIGSVGRPDLVGTTSASRLAGLMHASLFTILAQEPDHALVYPGHGEGSACGANMSGLRVSTLGHERVTNPYFSITDRDAFIEKLTRDLPPRPGNAVGIKRLNTEGAPREIPASREIARLRALEFDSAVASAREPLVIDAREPDAFAANHVRGAINIPLASKQFANRAAVFLETRSSVYLVLDDEEAELGSALTGLARVGGFEIRGVLEGGMHAWRVAGRPFAGLSPVSMTTLRDDIHEGTSRLLDVRSGSEWRAGHVEGATWIPWEELEERMDELDPEASWVVTCATGYRSSMAASLLAREGFAQVGNLLGGMTAWSRAGFPLIEEAPRPASLQDGRAADILRPI